MPCGQALGSEAGLVFAEEGKAGQQRLAGRSQGRVGERWSLS